MSNFTDDDDDTSGRSRSSSGASTGSSASGSSSHSGEGRSGGTGNAVMSMFASYYGIEDTGVAQMKGTIDDANFDSENFVRVGMSEITDLLEPIVKLVCYRICWCKNPSKHSCPKTQKS